MFKDKNIVIGICGGIACYKACDIISYLKGRGACVDVIMTENSQKFITALTMETLSGNKVVTDMFEEREHLEVEHISLAKKADLFLIVPATANIIGKIANGIADDMLSTTVMATKAKVVIAPAMNTAMYENSIVRENMEKLKKHGYLFIEPADGRLACGDEGAGKLADRETIIGYIENVLEEA